MFVLAADLVIAADTAKIIQVFVRRGLVPDGGVAYLLPRVVGMHKAKELIFFGDDLSAADAERIGIVNKVVPAAELQAAAKEWAERLASGPTKAIGWAKKLLHDASELSRREPARKKKRCRGAQQPHAGLGRRRRVVPRAPRSRSGRAGERDSSSRTRPRSSGSGRRRSARASPTPSCRSRARRSRSRSTTRASRRRRSTGSRRTRWSRTARSTSRARSASATSRSSRRSASAAAPAAAWSGTRRWRSRPASARSSSRGARASGPSAASRPWAQASARLADGQQWTRPFGIIRPVDEIAMLTRRYMHEYGGDPRSPRQRRDRVPQARGAQSRVDDGPQAADARRLHERALDLRAAVPLRQLPRDRRRARGRRHVGRAGPRSPPPARAHPLVRAGPAAEPPDDDQLLHRRSAARPGVDRGAAPVGERRRHARRRAGRAALRRVQPADPALARGLRLLRARRRRPVHRQRQHRMAQRPAAR